MGKMDIQREGDIDYSQDPALSLGAAYAHSAANQDLGLGLLEMDVDRSNVDANFKYRGFGAHAEYYISDEDPELQESYTSQGD